MDQSSIDLPDPSRAICPNGDIVLVIGKSKTRIRIFSQCLICASKVFGAMFGPDWVEGQKLSKGISEEILLVDDDASAMYAICCIIHHRYSLLPATFTPHEVLQIAIHADKYDLCDALSLAKTQWLQVRGSTEHMEIACFMASSLLFDDTDMFIAHGLALMLHSTESFTRLLEHHEIWQILPTRIIYLLEERRNRMRAHMGELIIRETKSDCSCGWGSDRRDRWQELSRQYSPLKILDVPLAEVVKNIKSVSYEGGRKHHYSSYATSYWHEPTEYVQKIAKDIEIAEKEVSICLSCIRTREMGS